MKYPIFILAQDDRTLFMHTTEKELNRYEQIDIENNLYVGWDSSGTFIALKYNKHLNQPFVEYAQVPVHPISLKKVIENYAKEYFNVDYVVIDNDFVGFYLRLKKEFGKEKIHYGKGLLFISLLVFILCLILSLIRK